MEAFFTTLLSQYGISGAIIGLLIWQIVQSIKINKSNISKEDLKETHNSIKQEVECQISNIKGYIESEREVLKEMIDLSDTKLEMWKEHVDTKLEIMDERINNQPKTIVNDIKKHEKYLKDQHDKMFDKQLEIGPHIHSILNEANKAINSDHIFMGSFHNGTSNISGIPYYKFDLIAEKFRPDSVERDLEFSHMYYNADLMKHDKLPITLIQNGQVHYVIDENKQSELSKIDDIIYRRMVGRDIKQIALQLLKDSKGNPTGFIGCVRYDYSQINLNELEICGKKIENLYNRMQN